MTINSRPRIVHSHSNGATALSRTVALLHLGSKEGKWQSAITMCVEFRAYPTENGAKHQSKPCKPHPAKQRNSNRTSECTNNGLHSSHMNTWVTCTMQPAQTILRDCGFQTPLNKKASHHMIRHWVTQHGKICVEQPSSAF